MKEALIYPLFFPPSDRGLAFLKATFDSKATTLTLYAGIDQREENQILCIGLCWIALTRFGLVLTPPLAPEPIVPFFGLVWLDSILIKEMLSSFNCASSNACMKVVGLSSSTPPQLSSFRPTMKNSTKKSSGRLGIWLDNVQTLFGSQKWFMFVVANPVGALNWRMNECPHLRLTLV